MNWTRRHDEVLVKEIIMFEPWLCKKGRPERGQVWTNIAEALNQIKDPFFSVTQRSVRDHYNIMEANFKRIQAEREKASGESYEPDTDYDKGMCDIIEQFHDHDVLLAKEKQAKVAEENKEKEKAQDIVQASLETFKETQKRKGLENDESSSKKRRSETETLQFLREKNASSTELQKQQLELQKQDMELRKQQADSFNQMIFNAQNQTNQILQQQQALNLALLQMLNNQNNNNNQ